jgi:hypothetical protein
MSGYFNTGTNRAIIPQNNIVRDVTVFHEQIVVPDVRLYFHSAVNRDQPGENIVVTNYNNVVCFAPIPSVFRRRADDTQRPDVIIFSKYYTWINNRRWMNEISVQFYFDFFERDAFFSTWTDLSFDSDICAIISGV